MRLAVYTDYVYHRSGGTVSAERAFALFLSRVGEHFDEVVVIGRLSPSPGASRYPLSPDIRFVEVPYYDRLVSIRGVGAAVVRSVRRFWRLLDDVDTVWLLGPHPVALVFAVIAKARRRRVALGVRQDSLQYVRRRHPGRRIPLLAMAVLDAGFRLIARRTPTVAVGGEIAEHYRNASRLLEINVSLVSAGDIVGPEVAETRRYDGDLDVLAVGRLEPEKNPLLLADILGELRAEDPRWRLVVVGEGPLKQALAERLEQLGVASAAELRGYVPINEGLLETYASSHAFLHVSLTEGAPQVLLEAFASRLPVVATAVGGVAAMAGEAAVTVPPGSATAAADALRAIAGDGELRARLVDAGVRRVAGRTVEVESERVAAFLGARVAGRATDAIPAGAR